MRSALHKLMLRAIGCGALLVVTFAGSARAEAVSVDPASAVVVTTPHTVRLAFDSVVDPQQTDIKLFTTNHDQVPVGPVHSTGDPKSLMLDLPDLSPGVYTIIWQSAATPTTGTFAFAYDPGQTSPQVVVQPQPQFALPPLDRVIPRWLVYTTLLVAVGSLALRLFVWAPVLRTLADGAGSTWRRRVEKRLTWITAGALLLWIPASLTQAAWEAANASKRPFVDGFDPAVFTGYVIPPNPGWMWSIRLLLIAAACLTYAASVAMRGRTPRLSERLLLFGSLCLCTTELLVRTLPGDLSSDTPRTVFTWLLDWAHLLGAGVWVGGLLGLAATASLLRPTRGAPASAALHVIRGFSNVALVCVGGLTLSGLWTAWIHVGTPELLLTTLYGRTLLLKLAVVMVLIVLGGINLLHVLPRLEMARAFDRDRPSLVTAALRHFRGVIAAEAVLGLVVLAIVPFLSGSARNQDAQARTANLAQTAVIGTTPIEFRPSALQPGLVEYEVVLPKASRSGSRVSLRFQSAELGVPPTDVVALALGNGVYRATGIYAPMVGDWQVQVSLDDAGAATFPLVVRADPVAPPPNRAPAIHLSTYLAGLAESVAVVGMLLLATYMSRWLAAVLNRRSLQLER